MSINPETFSPALTIFALLLLASLGLRAQDLEIRAKVISLEPAVLQIKGRFTDGKTERNFSFAEAVADARKLTARIENMRFFDSQNREISFGKITAAEFLTAREAVSFSYQTKLEIPQNALSAAHISWLSDKHGLIQLRDILPVFAEKTPVKIYFDLPPGWKISTSEIQESDNSFPVENPSNAVFLIGEDWRESRFTVDETNVSFSIAGDWQFTESEARESASEILSHYRNIFGAIPTDKINIFLLPLPAESAFERWRAETRGSNLTILSAPTAFKTAALQRLNEQLRHEIFHLWLPNNLNLSGNYAWFYEGFAQYAALKAGVELNQIRFDDFLSTLDQAYELTNRRRQPVALLEAANSRWAAENSSLYAKGLVVAFLCDAALLRSGGKDMNKIFRQIFEKHRFPGQIQDGSATILKILESYTVLLPVVERHVKNANKLIWEKDFADLGIEKTAGGIKVKSKPGGREKDLLNELGYNNWRKLLRKQK